MALGDATSCEPDLSSRRPPTVASAGRPGKAIATAIARPADLLELCSARLGKPLALCLPRPRPMFALARTPGLSRVALPGPRVGLTAKAEHTTGTKPAARKAWWSAGCLASQSASQPAGRQASSVVAHATSRLKMSHGRDNGWSPRRRRPANCSGRHNRPADEMSGPLASNSCGCFRVQIRLIV